MPYEINESCICCGACVPECPVEAITEGSEIYVIDNGQCTNCGTCVDACPVDAILAAKQGGAVG